jgi:hypothetical protein
MTKKQRPRAAANSSRPSLRDLSSSIAKNEQESRRLPWWLHAITEPLNDLDLGYLVARRGGSRSDTRHWAKTSGLRRISSQSAALWLGIPDTGNLNGILVPQTPKASCSVSFELDETRSGPLAMRKRTANMAVTHEAWPWWDDLGIPHVVCASSPFALELWRAQRIVPGIRPRFIPFVRTAR